MSRNWTGGDPLLRALRAIAVIALLALLFLVVTDPEKANNPELLALLFGSILIALGYPVLMGLPSIIGHSGKDGKENEAKHDEEKHE